MCKQRLLFSRRHIFNADQERQEQRKKQSVCVKTEELCDCPSEKSRQEEKGWKRLSITSLFIICKKQRKRDLKFCGAGAGNQYLPISRILQTSSMPAALLQRREIPCLARLLFFIPKLLLSQGSPLRTWQPCLSHTASLSAASSNITNNLTAPENIPDTPNPLGILSLVPAGPRNYPEFS